MTLAEEVQEGLIEAGIDLYGEAYMLTFSRTTEDTPWGAGIPSTFDPVVAIEDGEEEVIPLGKSTAVKMLMFTVAYDGVYTPAINDSVTIRSREYKIRSVETEAPAGEIVMFMVGVVD